jgi:hypothetical protein
VDIVVFPEFVMSPDMLDAIQIHLRESRNRHNKRLKFVFAGTTYLKDNEGNFNNVLHILKEDGTKLPYTYYKNSPFVKYDDTERYIDSNQILSCERITNPGKECVLLDIEGFGRILPSICRDFIDGEYTNALAHIFKPELILIPAWSESVNSFLTEMCSFANNIHSSSILCNCCNAVDKNKTKIGACIIPEKKESIVNSSPKYFYRSRGCYANCESQGGCVFILTIEFGGSSLLPQIEKINATSHAALH